MIGGMVDPIGNAAGVLAGPALKIAGLTGSTLAGRIGASVADNFLGNSVVDLVAAKASKSLQDDFNPIERLGMNLGGSILFGAPTGLLAHRTAHLETIQAQFNRYVVETNKMKNHIASYYKANPMFAARMDELAANRGASGFSYTDIESLYGTVIATENSGTHKKYEHIPLDVMDTGYIDNTGWRPSYPVPMPDEKFSQNLNGRYVRDQPIPPMPPTSFSQGLSTTPIQSSGESFDINNTPTGKQVGMTTHLGESRLQTHIADIPWYSANMEHVPEFTAPDVIRTEGGSVLGAELYSNPNIAHAGALTVGSGPSGSVHSHSVRDLDLVRGDDFLGSLTESGMGARVSAAVEKIQKKISGKTGLKYSGKNKFTAKQLEKMTVAQAHEYMVKAFEDGHITAAELGIAEGSFTAPRAGLETLIGTLIEDYSKTHPEITKLSHLVSDTPTLTPSSATTSELLEGLRKIMDITGESNPYLRDALNRKYNVDGIVTFKQDFFGAKMPETLVTRIFDKNNPKLKASVVKSEAADIKAVGAMTPERMESIKDVLQGENKLHAHDDNLMTKQGGDELWAEMEAELAKVPETHYPTEEDMAAAAEGATETPAKTKAEKPKKFKRTKSESDANYQEQLEIFDNIDKNKEHLGKKERAAVDAVRKKWKQTNKLEEIFHVAKGCMIKGK
jgi:hypothetical protein